MRRPALSTVLFVAALALLGELSVPAGLEADWCLDGPFSTSQYWATAPTCTSAQTLFRSQAFPEAAAICGGATKVYGFTTPPCQDWSAQDPANPWLVDGYATFYCRYLC